MKKILAVLVCAVILAAALVFPACGETALWDRQGTLEPTEIPAEAFLDKQEDCTALAPTGHRMLICGADSPHLWDAESGESIPLHLGDAETRQVVRSFLEQLEAAGKMQFSTPLSDETLFSEFLRSAQVTRRQYAVKFLPEPASVAQADMIRVTDNASGLSFLLDLSDGALYTSAEGKCAGICGGRMLILRAGSQGSLCLKELKTGEETLVNFSALSGLPNGGALITAGFLPDGSICAVLRNASQQPAKEMACAAVVYTPDGRSELYPLGLIPFAAEPDLIFCAGTEQIVLQNRLRFSTLRPFLIDRSRKSVFLLSCADDTVQAAALSDCMDGEGRISQPEDPSLLVYGVMADSRTLLVHSLSYRLLLFRPDSMETRPLLADGTEIGFMAFASFSGNGLDAFLGTPGRTYYSFR